jgi:hypothetical protein
MPRQIEHEIEFLADAVWIQMAWQEILFIQCVCPRADNTNIHRQTRRQDGKNNKEEISFENAAEDVAEENKSTLISF